MAKKITNKLNSLPQEVSIDRVVDHPQSLELFISSPEPERLCPLCGSRNCVIKDSGRSITDRHIAVAGKGVFPSISRGSSASNAVHPSQTGLTLFSLP